MNYTVTVPDIGTSDAVEVIEVCVAPGETIAVDDPLIVLESDKASMDIPSDKAGVVESIKLKVGDKVNCGHAILELTLSESAAVGQQELTPVAPVDAPVQILPVLVPELGTSDAVEVIDICVSVGDTLEIDTPTITLESDKASMDIPSDKAGVIKAITIKLGDKLRQGDKILDIETTSAAPAEISAAATSAAPAAVSPAVSPPSAIATSVVSSLSVNTGTNNNLHAGPAVRRLARELNIDLAAVRATGPRGRITKNDLIELVKLRMQGAGTPADTGVELADIEKFGSAKAVDMNRIQKLTAKSMTQNWQNIPHVTQFDTVDITEIEKYRKSLKAQSADKEIKLTILPFIVKAAAIALEDLKQFNVAVGKNNQIIHKDFINISVAMDTPGGLVVPVIKDVNEKDIWEIAADIGSLYAKAIANKLKLPDIQGGCFTVSSLGSVGGKYFTPIVNAPEVAILGVSRSSMQPVYNGSEFVAHNILPISLSFDHRVINGVDGAKMTRLIAELLEDYQVWVG
jgi:pyruvate dehydrogenase E2 component (dihydrolipoamide acetyltransferase)